MNKNKNTNKLNNSHLPPPAVNTKPELPQVNIETLDDHPTCYTEYKLPTNYVKYNEKTIEELDEEVEYDMDEEDNVWLKIINEQREQDPQVANKQLITQEQFEFLMDRLEKDSHFQQASSSPQKKQNDSLSLNTSRIHNDSTNIKHRILKGEDALCCICLDGECINSNVILFCDMCNLAVHQECYGVPYIPEGQWLCRKCIQSPSAPVTCILCPNKYGAFKQTDRGEWAHVVCSIWIPEVHFANTVFLEPIIGTENIDRARWKLMCYICRKRNVGACIQCDKQNCYTAFHVTCAQQAGLYMNIQEEGIETDIHPRGRKKGNRNTAIDHSPSSSVGEVRKCSYCDIHTPLEVLSPKTRKSVCKTGSYWNNSDCKEALKLAQKARMKKARKILAEQRRAPPVICLPVISTEKIEDILKRVDLESKEKFVQKLVNYWLLKRYSRNGVPILRRLQNSANLKKQTDEKFDKTIGDDGGIEIHKEGLDGEDLDLAKRQELKEKLTCWKKLRQDLEKARLLMELIRKRERLKRELVRIEQIEALYELNPFNGVFLQRLLDSLCDLDKQLIFTQPVDPVEVPTYYDCIKEPMDFSKIQSKINGLEYETFGQFEADFGLIINNCMKFNPKNTYYYKYACKTRDQASTMLKQAKKICESIGSANEFIQLLGEKSSLSNALKDLDDENNNNRAKSDNQISFDDDKALKSKTPSAASKRTKIQPTPPSSMMSRRRLSTLKDDADEDAKLSESSRASRKSPRVNKELDSIEENKEADKNEIVESEKPDLVTETPSKRAIRSMARNCVPVNLKLADLKEEDSSFTPRKKRLKKFDQNEDEIEPNIKNLDTEIKNENDDPEEELNTNTVMAETQATAITGVSRRTAVLFKRNKSNSQINKTISNATPTPTVNTNIDTVTCQSNNSSSSMSNKKDSDSISDTSINKDLMNVSSSTNQTCDSNT